MPGPYVTTEDATQTFTYFMYQMQSGARSFTAPGGTPKSRLSDVADAYMSSCIKSSLKSEIGASSGVYTPACTEGTIRDMADQSRVLALSSAHKRTTLQKASPSAGFGTMFDIRRRALILAGDCSYEQSLVIKFPKAAAAFVAASNEAAGLCTRAFDDGSGGGMSIAEKYMMEKVDFQGKMKLGMETPGSGVYSTTCSDAAVSGDAEQKRVIGLAARFRAKATSPMRKAQMEFDARKAARVLYGKECAYEEGLFNKYPAVAAAMAGTGQGALY